jgi:hypothetical protein
MKTSIPSPMGQKPWNKGRLSRRLRVLPAAMAALLRTTFPSIDDWTCRNLTLTTAA